MKTVFMIAVAALGLAVPTAPLLATPIGDPQVSCQVSEASESKPGTPVRSLVDHGLKGQWSVPVGTRGCARVMVGDLIEVDMPAMTPGGVRIFGIQYFPSQIEGAK